MRRNLGSLRSIRQKQHENNKNYVDNGLLGSCSCFGPQKLDVLWGPGIPCILDCLFHVIRHVLYITYSILYYIYMSISMSVYFILFLYIYTIHILYKYPWRLSARALPPHMLQDSSAFLSSVPIALPVSLSRSCPLRFQGCSHTGVDRNMIFERTWIYYLPQNGCSPTRGPRSRLQPGF